jgi:hypothetical protein
LKKKLEREDNEAHLLIEKKCSRAAFITSKELIGSELKSEEHCKTEDLLKNAAQKLGA